MKRYQPLIGFLIIGLFIGIIILGFFFGWITSVTIFFIGMAAAQFFAMLIGLTQLRSINYKKEDLSMLVLVKMPLRAKKGFINKGKFYINSTFSLIDNSITWPYMLYFQWRLGQGKAPDMAMIATAIIKPPHLSKSIYYLVMSLLLGLLYYYQWIGPLYTKVATIILLAGVMSLLISFLIGSSDIAETFKKSPTNIYKAVFIMSVSITLSLVIYFMILLSVYNYPAFSFGSFNIVVSEFFKHDSIGLLWERKFKEIKPLNLVTDLSGLIFAATILATAKNLKNFKRTKENINVIVYSLLFRREYETALKWLNKVPRTEWGDGLRMYYMVIQAGLGNQAKVLDSFRYMQIEAAETNYPSDHKYWQTISSLRIYKIDEPFLIAFLYKWIGDCQWEGILFSLFTNECFLDEESFLLRAARTFFSEDPKWKEKFPLVDYILSNTGDGNPGVFESLFEKRDEIDTLPYDAGTVCIVELCVILACLSADPELDDINDRLDKFAARIETVNGPRDLLLVASQLGGMLIGITGDSLFYERLGEIYNRLEEIMVQGDCQHLVERLKTFRPEEE